MQNNSCVISLTNYEGGLLGLSAHSSTEVVLGKKDLKQEFAFSSSQASLGCMANSGNFLAVSGAEEVIKMYDLK